MNTYGREEEEGRKQNWALGKTELQCSLSESLHSQPHLVRSWEAGISLQHFPELD